MHRLFDALPLVGIDTELRTWLMASYMVMALIICSFTSSLLGLIFWLCCALYKLSSIGILMPEVMVFYSGPPMTSVAHTILWQQECGVSMPSLCNRSVVYPCPLCVILTTIIMKSNMLKWVHHILCMFLSCL